MNIRNFISENVFNQLSLYVGRLRTNIDTIMDEIDDVSRFIQVCNEYMDDTGAGAGSPIILDLDQEDFQTIIDFESNILNQGITIADANGNLTQFYLGNEADDIKTIYIKDAIFQNGYAWLQKVDDQIRLAWDIAYDIHHNAMSTIYDLFMSRWSGYLSEMSMWYDTVTTFLNGGWNNVTEMVALLQDRISNGSTNLISSFQDLKDSISAASSGGLSGIAQTIVAKLGMASMWNAPDDYNINYSSINNWHISDINWNTIQKGLLSAGQYLGQLLLFVGGPIVKAIGAGITLTTKLINFVDDTITTSSNASVNEKGWLASWYGDIHLLYDTIDDFKTKFPKITTLPAIVDTGLVKILATPKTYNGSEVIDYRLYDCPLYSPDLLSVIIQDLCTYFDLSISNIVALRNKFVSQDYDWVLMNTQYSYNPMDKIRMNVLYNNIATHCTQHSINTDVFDAYSDSDKRTCYLIGLILMSLYTTFTVRKTHASQPNIARVLPVWFFDKTLMGTAWEDITTWLNGSAQYPNAELNNSLSVGVTPFEMLTVPLCGQYIKYGQLTVPDWDQLISIKNWMSNKLNAYNLHDFIDDLVWTSGDIYHIERSQNNELLQASYYYSSHIGYYDWNQCASIYNENWCYANGAQSIIRYNPPQITYALAQFIRVMGIAVSVAVVAGMAVVTYKSITRNRRQAKLYARYSAAIDNYNTNPSNENFKIMKKTTRLLKRDIWFFGSSKYLTSLSGAAFGWGVDGSQPAVNTITSLLNVGQNYSNGSSSRIPELLKTIIHLISGE